MYSMAHGGSLSLPAYDDYEDLRTRKAEKPKQETKTTKETVDDIWQRIKGH